MINLKPCPFCGKTPVTVVDDETEEKFGVKCFACGGAIFPEKDTLEEAIEAWNRRVGDNDSERKQDTSEHKCETCKYYEKSLFQEPCETCSGWYLNKWERR